MEGKENMYQFNQKPLFVHCKELFDNPLDSDVTFVSKQNDEIKAHKLVLLTASSFFKTIFTSELESYKILLPNYSTQVISVFVQFFYNSGEILINESLIQDFACLCSEFNCQEIPVICDLIKNHKKSSKEALAATEDLIKKEVATNSSAIDTDNVVDTDEKVVIEFDEYFETHENVETIFFNENEGEFLDRPTESTNAKLEKQNEAAAVIKEEYLNVQYIVESPNFMIVDTEKTYTEEIEQKQDEVTCKGEEPVVDEVKMNSYDKKLVSRNTTFKQAQKPNEQQQHQQKQSTQKPSKNKVSAGQSITFPALAMNLTQLREEQNRFKKRLQEAINSCRDSGNSVKKAAKMFGVPQQSIERNLRGFRNI